MVLSVSSVLFTTLGAPRVLASAHSTGRAVAVPCVERSGGRANLTKNPSPRIDPGERPADPGWNGKRGTTSRKKNEANPQSLGQRNPLFFLGRHTTAAGREARMTDVEPQRPEAGKFSKKIWVIRLTSPLRYCMGAGMEKGEKKPQSPGIPGLARCMGKWYIFSKS